MLNKNAFKDKIQDLIDFYPSWGIRSNDSSVMTKWYLKFQHLTDEQFNKMVEAHIKKISFNPTVASLLECKPEVNGIVQDDNPFAFRGAR